jgi:hypothetical protein
MLTVSVEMRFQERSMRRMLCTKLSRQSANTCVISFLLKSSTCSSDSWLNGDLGDTWDAHINQHNSVHQLDCRR